MLPVLLWTIHQWPYNKKKKHVFVINIELKSLAPLVTDGYEHCFLLTVNTLLAVYACKLLRAHNETQQTHRHEGPWIRRLLLNQLEQK